MKRLRRVIPTLLFAGVLMVACDAGDEPDWLDQSPGQSAAPAAPGSAPPAATPPNSPEATQPTR